jgi:glycosyltransferase involved in cell wall biosynthesis
MEKNGGPSCARNKGLEMAKNEWIGYLDSDNKMHEDFLETYVGNIENNRNCEIFYAQIKCINSKAVIGKVFDFEELLSRNYVDVGVIIHTRRIYTELGGFDVNMKSLEDWDLIIRYTSKYVPIFIDKILLDYYDGVNFHRVTNNGCQDEDFKKVIINYYNRISTQEFLENHLKRNTELSLKNQEIQRQLEIIKQKDQELNYMRTSLRWKIPNYFYKFYKYKIKKLIPSFIFKFFLNPLISLVNKIQ